MNHSAGCVCVCVRLTHWCVCVCRRVCTVLCCRDAVPKVGAKAQGSSVNYKMHATNALLPSAYSNRMIHVTEVWPQEWHVMMRGKGNKHDLDSSQARSPLTAVGP